MTELALFPSASSLTMTSREIADLTGKLHKHVMRDIRQMLADLSGGDPERFSPEKLIKNQDSPTLDPGVSAGTFGTNNAGQPIFEYRLDKTHTMTLLTGYRADLRMKVIVRWQALEAPVAATAPAAHPTFAIPQTLHDARRLAADLAETNAQQHARLAATEPKAAALDRIATPSSGTLNLTNAAKTLQINPRALIQRLSANRWIDRRAGGKNWTAYQDRLQQGVLEQKIAKTVQDDGTDRIFEQVLVTPKGLTTLATMLSPLNGGAA